MAMVGMTPGLMGLTFSNNYTVLLISSFIMGFFFLAQAHLWVSSTAPK